MRTGEFFGTQRSIGRRGTGGRRRSEGGAVFRAEVAPRHDRNTQRLKEARGDRVHVDNPAFALFIVVAGNGYELVPTASGQRDDARKGGRPHAGNALDVLAQAFVVVARALCGVAVPGGIHVDDESSLAAETGFERIQVSEAADKETGAHQQHQR